MDRKDIMTLSDKVALSIANHASDVIAEYHAHRKENFHILEVEKSQVPNGAKLTECYETEKEYIILGSPLNEEHNCDEMGCSTVSHVRMRISKDTKKKEIELKPCPFCGGKASIVKEEEKDNFNKLLGCDGWFQLGCTEDSECPSYRVFSFPKKDKDLYVEKWNMRK